MNVGRIQLLILTCLACSMPESAETISHAMTSYAFALRFRLWLKLCAELIGGIVLPSPDLLLRCGGMDFLRTLSGRDEIFEPVAVTTDTSSFLSSSAIAFSREAQTDDRLFVGDADFPGALDTGVSGRR